MSWRMAWLGRGVAAFALLSAAAPAAAACSASTQAVSFGAYSPLSSTALDGVGTIGVTCDSALAFTIKLSAGNGTVDQRQMVSGASQLGYNLYVDAARLIIWGDGVNGSTMSATGPNADLTVYGRIPALQNVVAGAYADTIVVTVTY